MEGVIKKRRRAGKIKPNGFTLIELMVTLAIIGLLSALAGYNYLNQLPKRRANTAARQIWGDMHLARSSAQKAKKDVVVIFDTTNNTYSIIYDGDQDIITGPPLATHEYILQAAKLPTDIVFATAEITLPDGWDGPADDIDVDGVDLVNNRVFFQRNGRASRNNEDTATNLIMTNDRAIYVMPDNYDKLDALFVIYIEGISGLPIVKKYDSTQSKWPD